MALPVFHNQEEELDFLNRNIGAMAVPVPEQSIPIFNNQQEELDWLNKGEAPKEKGIVEKRPLIPATGFDVEGPSRSAIAAVPPALKRGALMSAQMGARILKALPIGGDERLTEFIKKTEELSKSPDIAPSKEARSGLRRWWEQGLESSVSSIGPRFITAAIGGLVGGPAGAVVGFKVGGMLTPIAFGIAEYQAVLDEAKEQGISEDEARKWAVISGLIEWGGESFANLIEAKMLGLGGPLKGALTDPIKQQVKNIMKQPAKMIAKNMAINYGIEALTEAFQEGGETYMRNLAGIETGLTPWEAAGEAIGPSLVMTTLFNVGGYSINKSERRKLLNTLSDPNAPLYERINASRVIQQGFIEQSRALAEKDPEAALQYEELGVQWDKMTRDAINNRRPIELDQTVTEAVEGYGPTKELPFEELTLTEQKKEGKKEKPLKAVHTEEEIQEQAQKPKVETALAKAPPPEGPAPEIKIPEVEGLEYKGIQKGIEGFPDQYVFTDLQTGSTFYTTDISEKNLLKHRDRIRANFKDQTKTPGLRPVEGLPGEKLRYKYEIYELLDLVKRGEPGRRIALKSGEMVSWGSSYPDFMANKGWTKNEVITAINKAMAGQKLGERQQEIWKAVKEEARGIFRDRIAKQKKERIQAIPTGDLEVGDKIKVGDEILRVTEKTDEKIVIKDGQKYELDPYFDVIKGRKIEGKQEAIPVTTEPSYIPEGVKPPAEMRDYLEAKGIKVQPKPELSPTEKGQYKLPGVKIGVEGKVKEEAPTLEGTPLMEFYIKKEREKVQSAFPIEKPVSAAVENIRIGETVKGITDKGEEVNGIVADIDKEEGSIFIGLPNGDIRKVKAETITQPAETVQEKRGITREPQVEITKEEKKPAEEKINVKASQDIADYVQNQLASNNPMTKSELIDKADEAFGGNRAEGVYTSKDAFDAMEMGINHFIVETSDPGLITNANVIDAEKEVDRIRKDILDLIPSQAGLRTEETDEFQQFSTPPDYSYVMNWVAHVNPGDIVLEPSAGLGGLVAWSKKVANKIIVNELSPRRSALLKEMGFDRVFTENAEHIHNILPKDIKPTVVLMNPPFSATAGRIKGKKKTVNSAQHLEQALHRLEPNGRLVALMGKGFSEDAANLNDWWKKIIDKYNVRANIYIEGKGYSKYGTSYDNRLIVIDKTGPTTGVILRATVRDIKDAIPLLKEIRNDRKEIIPSEKVEPQPRGGEITETGRGEARPELPAGIPTHVVGSEPGAKSIQREPGFRGPGREAGLQPEPGGITQLPDQGLEGGERPERRGFEVTARPEAGITETPRTTAVEGEVGPTVTPSITVESLEGESNQQKELTDSIYEEYTGERVKIAGTRKHPSKLVQSAAMATVNLPKATYQPSLPEDIITSGRLSDAQLEAVVYAGQAHEQMLPGNIRKGFFIGDGTGVGKGREISGIILDNMNKGRKKAVWITESSKLIHDAIRDFSDTGGDRDLIFDMGKIKMGAPITASKGILFTTYATLKSGITSDASGEIKQKAEKTANRLDQLVNWLGKDFDGVLVFDEAHNMRNNMTMEGLRGLSRPSLSGLVGKEIQKRLPNARVIYVSATGATEVNNLGYAERLGLWGEGTAFANARDFVDKIGAGGLAAMEVVARDMKAMGVYLSRNLSYDDVRHDRITHILSKEQREIYDNLAGAWQIVLKNIDQALQSTGQFLNSRAKSNAMSKFWGSHQRFFNQIITSMQMPTVIEDIKRQITEDKSVVLQLVNTNEAIQNRKLATLEEDEDLEDLDLTPRENLMQYIENSFPIQQYEEYTDDDGNIRSKPVYDSNGNPVNNSEAIELRDRLLDMLGSIKVPSGPLEILLDTFGTDQVAEVTGRSRRVVFGRDEHGNPKKIVQPWSPSKALKDADDFMAGKKRILVFSYAGGTGRSFHADLTKKNRQQRIHYLVQAGWRADKALQGFGRTHRTNQASAPFYRLVTTDLKGHSRFISSVARRLDQLGALTKGQRQTGSQGMFKASDNLESTYARDAKYQFFVDLHLGQLEDIGLDFQSTAEAMGLNGLRDRNGNLNVNAIPSIERFLNRILSLKIDMQNKVFDAFMERLEQKIEIAISDGTLDIGIENYKSDKLSQKSEQVIYTHPKTGAQTKYIQLEAGHKVKFLDFDQAKGLKNFEGFYKNKASGFVWAVQKWVNKTDERGRVISQYMLRSPLAHNSHTLIEYEFTVGDAEWHKWEKVDDVEAKRWWNEKIKSSPTHRMEKVHLITGAILPIWDRLPTDFAKIYRLQTDDKKRLIGRLIHEKELSKTLNNLGVSMETPKITPTEAYEAIVSGKSTLELVNGWKIRRSLVQGEHRIEIKGDLYQYDQELKRYGVYTERINYETRYFIPKGEKGPEVLERLLKNKPISQVLSIDAKGQLKILPKEKEYLPAREEQGVTHEELREIENRIKKILPKGTKLEFVDEIWVETEGEEGQVFDQALREWLFYGDPDAPLPLKVKVEGRTRQWKTTGAGLVNLIEVAIRNRSGQKIEATAYHEVWHSIRDLLSEIDKSILTKKYLSEEGEKGEAEAFARYAMGRKTLLPMSIRKIFDKVKRFIEAFGNYLDGLGFRTVEDIFGQAYEGRLPFQKVEALRRQIGTAARPFGPLYTGKEGHLKLILPQGINNDKSENPQVEKRMGEAYGLDHVPLIEKVKGEMFKTLHSFTRHFPELHPKRFGKVIDILRRFEQVPEFAKNEASNRLKGIVSGLNKPQLNIFGRVLILNDLVKDYESGLYDRQKKLPFGYRSIEEVQRDLSKFEAIADANRPIKIAIERRIKEWDNLKKQLVDYEVLPDAALKDSRYFHHQVLQYMAIKAYHPDIRERKQYTGLSSPDVRLHRKGWQIAREGSALDFNTNYLESEFEVFSQAIAQIETIKTLDRIQEAEDISDQFKDKAREAGKSPSEWKQFLPNGYTIWQPKKGFNFYLANTITDKAIEKILDIDQFKLYKETGKINIPGIGLAEIDNISIRRALAVGKRRAEWAIPIELAKTLDNFRDFKDEGPLWKFAEFTQSSWKQWILLNPMRVIKYNLNNLSGDVDIVLAYNPKILTKYAIQAMSDLYAQAKGRPLSQSIHNELKEAFRGSVIGSGITIHEIPDINKTGIFKILTGEKPNLIEKYWDTVKDYTNLRENVLRLAAYRFFKDELAKGHKLYGASKVSEVDAITDQKEKAAKLARELIGDYGNISQAGQWIRKHMIPFYSWMEINAPRYVRLIQNLRHEGKKGQIVGLSTAKTAKLGVKMLILYSLINLWNHIFFPDEEEELGRVGKKQLHLILGRRSDGTIRTLRFQGALSDALAWFGLEDFPEDFKEVMSGKIEWTKKFKEAILAGPERLFHGTRPLEKAGIEAMAGKTFYPEVTRPRPVRDKIEHILRTINLDLPYKYAMGKPTRGINEEIESLITYRTDPGEAAYYNILSMGREFLEEQGYDVPSFQPTQKSNILYYYKQAQRIGDKKAAQKYMEKYIEAGGTKQDLMRSIKKSHPLAIIPMEQRRTFIETLDAEDRRALDRAIDWWEKVYGG